MHTKLRRPVRDRLLATQDPSPGPAKVRIEDRQIEELFD
jgi:hypothetical protein